MEEGDMMQATTYIFGHKFPDTDSVCASISFWYFALDREGHPLVEPYNIFSYTFAVIAFGQLSIATGNAEYADIAKKTFDIVLSKVDNPKGRWSKASPGARSLKSFVQSLLFQRLP